jgi:hypothetical protein
MLTNASPLASQRLLPWRQVLVYRLFRPIKEQQGTEVLRVQACHRCLWSTYTFSPDRCRRYQGGRQHLTSTSRIDLSPRGSSPLFPSSQAYITTIITRVNSYTGVPYYADPTILAWETGNELGGVFFLLTAPPPPVRQY